ncbi:MAG: universal stress protein [Massilibacteroides sp.]|nr:universal stress protein [Massilibacteroides sp.]
MEDKIITLAIHTFERAQILKTLLEAEGIDVYINNVNQISPVVSSGVRVRIREKDLPHALRFIEEQDPFAMPKEKEKKKAFEGTKRILIPVDFSSYSDRACAIGIHYADKIEAEVYLLHAYYRPFFPSAILMGNTLSYGEEEAEAVLQVAQNAKEKMNKLQEKLRKKIAVGDYPDIHLTTMVREGLPEEVVWSVSGELHPNLIVMGTRGIHQKSTDLIGSVTAEIIETNKVPVLTIPENVMFDNLSNATHLAFGTSFSQQDLVVFDSFMELMAPYDLPIYLFNISTSKDEWNQIRLAGIREYLSKQYPNKDITFTVLADGDLLLAIEKFVRENHIDLIGLSPHKRNILSRLFNPSIARKMLFHTDTPLLVMRK